MSDIARTVESLYSAINDRSGAGIAACYHPEARFRDSLFDVRGAEVVAMWRMLGGRSHDLRVQVGDVRVSGAGRALARWTAMYTFTATGRPVVSEVRAAYRFSPDGRIIEHVDAFDLNRWAVQALGWNRSLLIRFSGAGLLRRKLRRQLDDFMAYETSALNR